jgi:nitrite reductase (NADH) small subunit
MSWVDVGPLDGLPARGARVVRVGSVSIAVFRTGSDQVYALRDQCPHRGGPLSQGIVHGERVTCPLHDWIIDLASGAATGVDEGCTATFRTRVTNGQVALELPDDLGRQAGNAAASTTEPPPMQDARACALFERA